VTKVRDAVGPGALLSASFDLHGNFSPRMARTLDIVTAYRTAPHIDIVETKLKAMHNLMQCLRLGKRPHLAYCSVPLGVSGEMSNTADEPCKSLYSTELHAVDGQPGILDASLFIGYVWADEPRTAASVLVTGLDKAVAERSCLSLATKMWDRRKEFRFGVRSGTIEEMLELAGSEAAKHAPVVISDSGDNPTAGGVGDVPTMVKCMGECNCLKDLSCVTQGPVDAEAVSHCISAGVGETVQLIIGGKLDTVNASPALVTGVVHFVLQEPVEYEINLEAGTDNPPRMHTSRMPTAAVLKMCIPEGRGAVYVTLTAERKPFHYEADFQVLQLEPAKQDIVVVKIGYLVPDLERLAATNLMALSPGAVFADVAKMPYKHVGAIYPKSSEMEWEPSLACTNTSEAL